MKTSKYNFIYNQSGRHVIYNSFSNALAILSDEEYDYISELDSGLEPAKVDAVDLQPLMNNGFVVEEDFNEIDVIRERMLIARYDTTMLGLTIAPTLDCNFRCSYCYEKGCEKSKKMSMETQNAIISMVNQQADTLKSLHVTWYGGEPLLAIDVIEFLTSSFVSICKENKINYTASIITNGYLLDESMAKRLMACKVNFCQVTIDGDENEHNKRRPYMTGKETYKTIVNNVSVVSRFIPISVRVNTDNNNKEAVYKVKEALKNDERISVYPAPVRANDECYSKDECFDKDTFLDQELLFFQKYNTELLMRKYPQRVSNLCCADCKNAYVIAPNGDLYKCWSDIGRIQFKIGNIQQGITNAANAIRYSKTEPTKEKECMECQFLPICMGGCPRDTVEKTDYHCLYEKTRFGRYITNLANRLVDEKDCDV